MEILSGIYIIDDIWQDSRPKSRALPISAIIFTSLTMPEGKAAMRYMPAAIATMACVIAK